MIKIKNKSKLNYRAMGTIIDRYLFENKLEHYEKEIEDLSGKKDSFYFEYYDKHFKLEIKFNKTEIVFCFEDVVKE